MRKKVYFAGSIRGGRVDAALYRRIIAHINRTDTVLTEHVGDLTLSALEQGRSQDAAIYAQDTTWLSGCDLLIAECSCPSLGVGYELAYAEARGVECHVLYNADATQLSAMICGNPYFAVHPYRSEEQVFEILDAILGADANAGAGC